MYRVVIYTDGKEFLLHDARADELQLIDPVITLEVGKAGEFTFQIPATHPHYDQIKPLSSELFVYDEENLLFCGRPLNKEGDFYNTSTVTCEGELAYLLDSIQRPYTYQGNLPGFLRQAIKAHNSQVEARKQVTVGDITVMDTNNYINRSNSDYATTLDTLKEKLVDTHGGYLRIRHVGEKRLFDYITDYGGINDQTIRFGENLLDLTSHIQPEGIITALIPLGAETETVGINDTKKRLDITSVNGGKDYIYSQEAVNTYGWIWGTQTWDDVTLPANLLRKAQAYLTECIALPVTIELNALDLGLIDVDVKKLELGYWTTVESVPHQISAPYLLSKASIHLTSPDQNTYVLGRTLPTFTGTNAKQQKEISAKIDQIGKSMNADIESAVENATELITGGKGGYILLDVEDERGNRTMPWRILVMDSPDKNQAKNILQINRNGIGFSTSGLAGPYKNAWTIDGQLVADFITTGTMLANRIKGGTLELGGVKNGDGALSLKNERNQIIASLDKDGVSIKSGTLDIDARGVDESIIKLHYADNTSHFMPSGMICENDQGDAIEIQPGWIWFTSGGQYAAKIINDGYIYTSNKVDVGQTITAGGDVTGANLIAKDKVTAGNAKVQYKLECGRVIVSTLEAEDVQCDTFDCKEGITEEIKAGDTYLTVKHGLVIDWH